MPDAQTNADRLRVLMISKALVVGSYQSKAEAIARHPELDLTVVVPPSWRDARGDLHLERAHTAGYTLRVEPIRFNGRFHWHFYPTLPRILRDLRPHVVHIDEEPYNLATFLALRAAKRAGARVLFFTWQNIHRRYPPPFRWMERCVLTRADAAIAGNPGAEAVLRRKGYTGPLRVIPQFGVDPEVFQPRSGPPPERPFTIGYAGRLVPEKGLDIAIRAALGISDPWRMRLAGDGPERGYLATQAGILNIGGQVAFEGHIPSTQMPHFYHELDTVVLPSLTRPNWKEQFGRLLVEAMASGVPVVASDSGAIPWVVGEAGLIVPEDDEEALRTALQSLAAHPALRAQLARAGRQRVLEHFTQAHIAAETVRLYHAMVT